MKRILRAIKNVVLGRLDWRGRLFSYLRARPDLHLRYLNFAKGMVHKGLRPPLTVPDAQHEQRWRAQGTDSSDVNPDVYTNMNDSVEKLFADVLTFLKPESRILEIGCNAGRSLHYLHERGFRNLTGIEIGGEALETFRKTFPGTYADCKIHHGNAADILPTLETGAYDLVFTHSVLVNIPAKHNRIFREIRRVCGGYLLTLESEGSSRVYPRDFGRIFEKEGFVMVGLRWLVWNGEGQLVFPDPVLAGHHLRNNTIRLFARRGLRS